MELAAPREAQEAERMGVEEEEGQEHQPEEAEAGTETAATEEETRDSIIRNKSCSYERKAADFCYLRLTDCFANSGVCSQMYKDVFLAVDSVQNHLLTLAITNTCFEDDANACNENS